MSNLWDTYETDEAREKEGTWVDIPDKDGEVAQFLLARMGGSNRRFTSAVEKFLKPHRRRLVKGRELPEAVQREAMIHCISRHVILDWKDVTDREGNDWPCTVENIEMLLKAAPALLDVVMDEAMQLTNFQSDGLEEEAKNSSKSLPAKSVKGDI